MGAVRPLTPADMDQVADLHRRVFHEQNGRSPVTDGDRSYLERIFLDHPWTRDSLPSLVYEDGDGKIIGCLGVVPREMSFNGQPIQATVSHSFMVEPGRRSPEVALKLSQVYFAGPQELSLAEGNDKSRKIWEAFQGATSMLYSFRWTRPLRPVAYALQALGRRGVAVPLLRALSPLGHLADAVSRILPGPFRSSPSSLRAETLDPETLLNCLAELSCKRSLRPRYDSRSLHWLLDILDQKMTSAALHKIALRDAKDRIAGWYLCHHHPEGVSEVLQMGSRPDSVAEVLDHLFDHAWRGGMAAVAGQLDPLFTEALAAKNCFFHAGGSWLLIHSKNPHVLEAIHRGDAFLSRLEGEWWIQSLLDSRTPLRRNGRNGSYGHS
jgi:hypothetical protein